MSSINPSQGAPNTAPAVNLVAKNVANVVGKATAGVVLGAVGGAATNMVQGAVNAVVDDLSLQKAPKPEKKQQATSSDFEKEFLKQCANHFGFMTVMGRC